MKKRYIGKSAASLADGRVVLPGQTIDLPAKAWAANAHHDDSFIATEDAKQGDTAPAAKKSDKE